MRQSWGMLLRMGIGCGNISPILGIPVIKRQPARRSRIFLLVNLPGTFFSIRGNIPRSEKNPEYSLSIITQWKVREAGEDNIFPLRQRNKIVVQNSNHSLARSGFMYRGTQLFNSLPVSLRMEEKVSSFRTGVKKWIIESIPVKPPWESQNKQEISRLFLSKFPTYFWYSVLRSTYQWL